jgi:hypothetical protein
VTFSPTQVVLSSEEQWIMGSLALELGKSTTTFSSNSVPQNSFSPSPSLIGGFSSVREIAIILNVSSFETRQVG